MSSNKSKITLFSIIAILIISTVSMFAYGCFRLLKKDTDSQALITTEVSEIPEVENKNAGGTHSTLGWSSSDWAWYGNDDYGMPDNLPVPRVFMKSYKAYCASDYEGKGKVVSGSGKQESRKPSEKVTISFFKDANFNIENIRDKTIYYAGNKVLEAVEQPNSGYIFDHWEFNGSTIIAHFRPIQYNVYYYGASGWTLAGTADKNSIIEWKNGELEITNGLSVGEIEPNVTGYEADKHEIVGFYYANLKNSTNATENSAWEKNEGKPFTSLNLTDFSDGDNVFIDLRFHTISQTAELKSYCTEHRYKETDPTYHGGIIKKDDSEITTIDFYKGSTFTRLYSLLTIKHNSVVTEYEGSSAFDETKTTNSVSIQGVPNAGYTFDSWSIGETAITAVFDPIEYTAKTYINSTPIDTEYIEGESVSYIYCGGNVGLPKINFSYGLSDDNYLFIATSWKIGPFDENNYLNKSDYSAEIGSYLNIEDSETSVTFILNPDNPDAMLLDVDGDGTNDGYYYEITGIKSGSLGNIDKAENKDTGENLPIITPYWVRTTNYELYYNNITTPTFHSEGSEGANGFDVTVVNQDRWLKKDGNTSSVIVNSSNEITILGLSDTENTATIQFGDTAIEYPIVNGYKYIGFRYAFIGIGTNEDDINSIKYIPVDDSNEYGLKDWSVSTSALNEENVVYKWNEDSNNGALADLNLDAKIYAICIQPIMELIPLNVNINLNCNEHNEEHGGEMEAYTELGNVTVGEGKTITVIIDGEPTSTALTLTNVVRGIKISESGNVISFINPEEEEVASVITTTTTSEDGVDLYDFAEWIYSNVAEDGTTISNIDANIISYVKPIEFNTTAYYALDGGVPTISSQNETSEGYYYCKTTVSDIPNPSADNIVTGNGKIVLKKDGVDIKYFDCWQIGPFDSNGNYRNDNDYKCFVTKEAEGKFYLTLSGPGLKIRFNLKTGTPVVDINESRYYLLDNTNEIKGCAPDFTNGNYGDLAGLNGSTVITARWLNIYDLTVFNDGDLWEEKVVPNNDYQLLGIKTNIAGNSQKSNKISLKVYNDEESYRFITDQSTAFYNVSDTSYSSANSTSKGTNYFGIYNYGYVLTGWYITFTDLQEVKHYIVCSGEEWTQTEKDVYDKYKVEYNDIVNLSEKTISDYTGFIDNLYTAGLNKDIKLTITPVWIPATIQVIYNKSTNLKETSFNSAYTLDTAKVTLPIGQSLAYLYFNTDNGNDIIVNKGTWNYYQIDNSEFEYIGGKYKLGVQARFVDDIFRINLEGVKESNGFNITDKSISDHDYGNGYAGTKYNGERYNYANTGYDFGEYSSGWIEEHTKTIKGKIDSYTSVLDNNTHHLLRKVFYDGLDNGDYKAHIYLAHNHTVGVLPAYDHTNYQLIFWENYSRDKQTSTNNIYKTSLFDETKEPGHANDAYGKATPEDWSYNGSNTNLMAHYFRKYYFMTPKVIEENKIGQFGYLIINSEDMIEKDEGYEGTYLAIALKKEDNSTYQMYYYDISSISGFTLKNVTITDGPVVKYNGTILNNCKDNKIKFYSGCTITITAYDQSKDALGMQTGKFDTMVGYRFAETVVAKNYTGPFTNDYLNGYNYILEFESADIDPIGTALGYVNGAEITFEFEFEKINYTMDVKIDNPINGSVTIVTKNGSFVQKTKQTIDNIKVGDTISINYNAILGYDLQENALSFIIDGTEVQFALNSRTEDGNGYVQQNFIVAFDGTWLREKYYYCAYDIEKTKKEFSASDTKLGCAKVNTEQIEFDYMIRLIDSTGVIIGEELQGTWTVADKEISIPTSIINKSRNNYFVKYCSVEYALIERYVSNYLGRTDLFNIKYAFPLTTDPCVDKSNIVSNFSKIYNWGSTVIHQDDRTITMILKVEPIYNLTVIGETGAETSTDRMLKIYNKAQSNQALNEAWYKMVGGVETQATILTYRGLKNVIQVNSFDEYLYDGLKFSNDVQGKVYGKSNLFEFTLDGDAEIIVSLNKARYELKVNYYTDNVLQTERPEKLQELDVNDLQKVLAGGGVENLEYIQYGDMIRANYALKQQYQTTFKVRIEIVNDIFYTNAEDKFEDILLNKNEYFNNKYTFEINVHIYELPNDDATIIFKLKDNSQARIGDDFGEFTISVDGTVIKTLTDSTSTLAHVYVGKSFSVGLNLNKGYKYSGQIQIDFANPIDKSMVDDSIELESNYTLGTNSKTYYILLEKEVYKLGATTNKLEFNNSPRNNYNFKVLNPSTGNYETKDSVVVGDSVRFAQKEYLDREVFVKYYYGESKVEISNNTNTTFVITEDMIVDSKIILGVETRVQYEVKTIMDDTSIGYLNSCEIFASGVEIGINDTMFVPKGNIEIKLSSIAEGKYEFYYKIDNGELIKIAEVSGFAQIDSIVFTSDTTITIVVAPVNCNISVTETHDGVVPTDDLIANVNFGDTNYYGENELVNIVLTDDEEYFLTTIVLRENDAEEISITINKKLGLKLSGTEDNTNYVSTITAGNYTIKIVGSNLTIEYLVKNNLTLSLDYTSLVKIEP